MMSHVWKRALVVLGVLTLIPIAVVHAEGFGTPTIDGSIDLVYGIPEASDPANDEPQGNQVMDLVDLYVVNDADFWYFCFTIDADVTTTNWGKYGLFIDTTNDAQGGNTTGGADDAWGRNVRVVDPHKPEFVIRSWVDNAPYGPEDTQLWAWNGTSWTGPVAIAGAALGVSGGRSILEWKVAKSAIGSPGELWCEAHSTAGTASDNVQDTSNDPPDDWNATNWTTTSVLVNSTPVPETAGSDVTPPTLISARGAGPPFAVIELQFSEPVDLTTSQTAGNYSVPGLTVLSAVRQADPSRVQLLVTPQMANGVCYTVTVTGVKDLAGNTIINNGTTNVDSFKIFELLVRGYMKLRLQEVSYFPEPDTFAIEGSRAPLTWDPTCDDLIRDADGDSVYTGTFHFVLGCDDVTGNIDPSTVEYKFTHQCVDYETSDNHVYNFDDAVPRDTLDIWWNNIAPQDITNRDIDVVYFVDMSRMAGPPVAGLDTVAVNGSALPLSWDIPPLVTSFMRDDGVLPDTTGGDDVWSARIRFPAGTTKNVEFKYVMNGGYECEFQSNRDVYLDDTIFSTTTPIILPTHVWNVCEEENATQNAMDAILTLDMSDVLGPAPLQPDTVAILGSQYPLNWTIPPVQSSWLRDDGVAPDETAGDNIWTVRVSFPAFTFQDVQYKFILNGGFECQGQGNRKIRLPDDLYSTTNPWPVPLAEWDVCDGAVDVGEGPAVTPSTPIFLTLRPNPTELGVVVAFEVPEPGMVRLAVHDIQGRLVRILHHGVMREGERTVSFDGLDASGRPVAPGVYFVRLDVGSRTTVKTLTVLR